MIKLYENGVFISQGEIEKNPSVTPEEAKKNTISYKILESHNTTKEKGKIKLRFDALVSHDITYVGIIQTARASGLSEFPMPYVLTNCHNSLCAIGGTINEDDHAFGLSAAKKYGGIYVPANLAVIHQYMREVMSGCGKMILGSDSHTRYGALGTMSVGEGGPELVKQLLGRTYDENSPEIIAVRLRNKPGKHIGPHDVALSIIGAVFKNNFVQNKVMEFIGDGISSLTAEFRCALDVMTAETACLSTIWQTDDIIRDYYIKHGRSEDYKELSPSGVAYYDGMVDVDLSEIEPMIALPFHPSNVYTIRTLKENAKDILTPLGLGDKITGGGILADQGIIAGCAGGLYENLRAAADIMNGRSVGNGSFSLSAYPASQPVYTALIKSGSIEELVKSGALIKSAYCGPCFGVEDVPQNGGFSIRHTTRNFPNREGSKPSSGQTAYVALMDARSIAATAQNGGILTGSDEIDVNYTDTEYIYDDSAYKKRVYNGWKNPASETELKFGPNITDWPQIPALEDNILLSVASVIMDPVTTTDELIPSGESSSYRSNPQKMAELTLSRKDPSYLKNAKSADVPYSDLPDEIRFEAEKYTESKKTSVGSLIYAIKPGDGSAREYAAACQRVLGGAANIASEYATKRYRSNLINWGMLPFIMKEKPAFETGDYIFIPGIKKAVAESDEIINAYIIKQNGDSGGQIELRLGFLTGEERDIILSGCLINYYSVK